MEQLLSCSELLGEIKERAMVVEEAGDPLGFGNAFCQEFNGEEIFQH